jgi:hypothetical protein
MTISKTIVFHRDVDGRNRVGHGRTATGGHALMTTPADGTSAGIAAAFGSAWTSTSPSYTRIDASPVQVVTGYQIRRGRAYS